MNLARLAVAAGLVAGLAGCGLFRPADGAGVSSATLDYRAALSRGDDPRDMTIKVGAPGASVDEVRESVRFAATRYCLSFYGASDTDWALDPDTGDWSFTQDGGQMAFSARCTAR